MEATSADVTVGRGTGAQRVYIARSPPPRNVPIAPIVPPERRRTLTPRSPSRKEEVHEAIRRDEQDDHDARRQGVPCSRTNCPLNLPSRPRVAWHPLHPLRWKSGGNPGDVVGNHLVSSRLRGNSCAPETATPQSLHSANIRSPSGQRSVRPPADTLLPVRHDATMPRRGCIHQQAVCQHLSNRYHRVVKKLPTMREYCLDAKRGGSKPNQQASE